MNGNPNSKKRKLSKPAKPIRFGDCWEWWMNYASKLQMYLEGLKQPFQLPVQRSHDRYELKWKWLAVQEECSLKWSNEFMSMVERCFDESMERKKKLKVDMQARKALIRHQKETMKTEIAEFREWVVGRRLVFTSLRTKTVSVEAIVKDVQSRLTFTSHVDPEVAIVSVELPNYDKKNKQFIIKMEKKSSVQGVFSETKFQENALFAPESWNFYSPMLNVISKFYMWKRLLTLFSNDRVMNALLDPPILDCLTDYFD